MFDFNSSKREEEQVKLFGGTITDILNQLLLLSQRVGDLEKLIYANRVKKTKTTRLHFYDIFAATTQGLMLKHNLRVNGIDFIEGTILKNNFAGGIDFDLFKGLDMSAYKEKEYYVLTGFYKNK